MVQPRISFFLITCTALLMLSMQGLAQSSTPFIKLVQPSKTSNQVNSGTQFIAGSTCISCKLTVNGDTVKVYSSGGFAYALNLRVDADTSFLLVASSDGNKPVSKTIQFRYTKPAPELPVTGFAIALIETLPEGDLVVKPGDQIRLRVKATPGATVTALKDTRLFEMPAAATGGIPGIYQGTYTVQPSDSFMSAKLPVTLESGNGQRITKESKYRVSVLSSLASDVAITTGRLAYLEYGLGEDRLGGAKIGYLDSLVQLQVIGKTGNNYKIQLAPDRIAYIPDNQVTLMPKGSFAPASLTGSISLYGDEKYDYVSLQLATRLPYQSFQELDPSRLVIDVFGATNNTNWISQLQTAKEIRQVDYEQLADGIFRIKIGLKHAQHWGHSIYYKGNNLVIRVKQQPKDLSLQNLTIAIDAGHGGSNTGAGGPTGSSEKQLALDVSLKLQRALLARGAKVLMTRTTEAFVDNKERILKYRDNQPDLLVSIHLNSSGNPIKSAGTSTHYRYIGNRSLSVSVNNRMQELGLPQYGVIGSFNFMLNSPTEYPNVLVETLFVSNPAEEDMMLRDSFRQAMADKILQGIIDFLQQAR